MFAVRGISRSPAVAALLAALLSLGGCQSPRPSSHQPRLYHSRQVIKPVMAVMDFENLANFNAQWNLGRGMADLLVSELLDTEKVTVLERRHLGEVLNELTLQGGALFRREGKVERGRLKNAKYLVRGVVTDFTITAEASGWFGISWLRLFGRGSQARVAINLKVSEVETGEVVASLKTDSTVSAGGFGGEASYKGISFGGDTFFRTPLGRATESAIHKAVRRILRGLPVDYWQPCVAEVAGAQVVVNGGANTRVRVGDRFAVRDAAHQITDPVTGNVLETIPGRVIGQLQVTEVLPCAARATLTQGTAQRGLYLEPVKAGNRRATADRAPEPTAALGAAVAR